MTTASSIFSAQLIAPAIGDAFSKLDPRELVKNPVLFTTAVVALLLTVLLITGGGTLSFGFQIQLIVWLWLTVLFGTFAEALAEGRGRAQAASLRATKSDLVATLPDGRTVPASQLARGDTVLVATGELIPADGEVIEGFASVNEAAITGESAPVIREAGGDRSAVTAGTRVISDKIAVRVTQEPGRGFLDRMIALVEGAERQKTPNEIALTILLVGLTIIFLIAVATIPGFAGYAGGEIPVAILAALLITLIPTTIAALLSAIGIAGMDRLVRFNVLAKSAARSRRQAMSTCCCSTRPAPSPSATVRQASSARSRACRSATLPKRRCSPASPTRRRKAARSSRSPASASMCGCRPCPPVPRSLPSRPRRASPASAPKVR